MIIIDTTSFGRLADKLDEFPGILSRHIVTELDKHFIGFIERFRANRLSGRPGLNRISGTLSDSFEHRIGGNELGSIEGDIGTDIDYARFHEYGSRYMPPRLQFYDSFFNGEEESDRDRALIDAVDSAFREAL